MKIGIDVIDTYTDKPPFKLDRDFKFNEDGKGKYIVDLYNENLRCIITRDIMKGNLGDSPGIYKWLNKPEKIVNGKTITKKNYRVL